MPKARKARASLVPLKFDTAIALSTLANDAVITAASQTLEQDFDVISTDLIISIDAQTVGEGPIEVGMASGIYSTAEIAENLVAEPLSQYGPEMERSRRAVRHYGNFVAQDVNEILNDGKPIRRKMFLRCAAGQPMADMWARNNSGSALTGGAVVTFSGTHWGRWK